MNIAQVNFFKPISLLAGAAINEIINVNAFFAARDSSTDPSALQKSFTESISSKRSMPSRILVQTMALESTVR